MLTQRLRIFGRNKIQNPITVQLQRIKQERQENEHAQQNTSNNEIFHHCLTTPTFHAGSIPSRNPPEIVHDIQYIIAPRNL